VTTDEWVHKLNELAGEIEDWMAAVHPSTWEHDGTIRELTEKYRKLAKRGPDDEQQVG